jgi:hypothetical protein
MNVATAIREVSDYRWIQDIYLANVFLSKSVVCLLPFLISAE